VNSPIDLQKFEVTAQIAAMALNYMLEHSDQATIVTRGNSEWFMGWGGRSVVKTGDFYELKSFRRFEYRRFDLQRDDSVAVTVAFTAFREAANRKENENEEDQD